MDQAILLNKKNWNPHTSDQDTYIPQCKGELNADDTAKKGDVASLVVSSEKNQIGEPSTPLTFAWRRTIYPAHSHLTQVNPHLVRQFSTLNNFNAFQLIFTAILFQFISALSGYTFAYRPPSVVCL